MKRGRKRKRVSTEEEEGIKIPSSAVLPARVMTTTLAVNNTLPVNFPIIKKEIKVETDSIPSHTGKTCENTNEDGVEKNITTLPVDLLVIKKEKEEINVETDFIPSDTDKTCENTNEDGVEKNITTLPVNNTLPVNLPIIEKEGKVKTDFILSDTDKTCENTNEKGIENIEVIRNLTSKCLEITDVSQQIPQTTDETNNEANNELFFNLQNLKSEPVSRVGCTADSNYCETNVGNLDLTNIKCEPRSRSSSTETVLADESLQLPLAECQSDTSTKSRNFMYQVSSVCHNSPDVGKNSATLLSKEMDDISLAAPISSPNICVSKHKNSTMQICTKNISFVTKLFKYSNFDIEIVKSDVKDCLNYLESTYTSKKSLDLFFSHDPFQRQHENPASEHLQSSPVNSSIPTEVISTNTLKKIIEISSRFSSSNSSNLPIPHQNNSDINTLAVSGSISPTLCSPMNKVTGDNTTANICIKDEPVDDYKASSVITLPAVSHVVSISDKVSSSNLTLPFQNNSENTNINALSVSGSIRQLPTPCSPMNEATGDNVTLNIRVKDEPVDDYDLSSAISSPTVSHLVSTSDKTSSGETTTEMHALTKKMKISPDLETGLSIDTPVSHLVSLRDKKSSEETIAESHNLREKIKFPSVYSVLETGQSIDTRIHCSPTKQKCTDSFTPDIRIENEPLDTYDASSVITSPTVSHLVPISEEKTSEETTTGLSKTIKISSVYSLLETGQSIDTQMKHTVSHRVSRKDKRSAKKKSTEIQALKKKIKISPDYSLETGYNIDTLINPGDGNEKCDSTATTKGSIHNQSHEIGRTISDTLKCWPLSPHNSCSDKNKVSDTKNTMSSIKSISSIEQSDIDKNLTVTSNELFNPKIRKTKPLVVCRTPNISTVFQRSLTACRRSTGEADNDQVSKINTVTELQDHSVASGTDDRVETSKVTNNILRNNGNMNHDFAVSDSKNSKDIESVSFKSVASMPITYSHLVPQGIHKTVLCTNKAPNTNLRTILSAEPRTSFPDNFTIVTTVSDSNINSNSTNYNQKTPVINKFLKYSTMQHAEKTNLGDNRNPSHVSNRLACKRIIIPNHSQPCISPKNATTKKKISTDTYFQRKSSLHLPCTQKNISQNSDSQISSPDSSTQPIIASLEKQQNNRTPIAYSKRAPQCNKSTSASGTKIALNAQHKSYQKVSSESISIGTTTETSRRSETSSCNQNQVIAKNSNVSPNPPRRSPKSSAITSRDPRKPNLKSNNQEVFEPRKQDFSSILRRDTAGNKFIDTKDLPNVILNWNVSWLFTQKKLLTCPPICDNYLRVKDNYQCVQNYYDTYQPLHLLNIWCCMYDAWEKSKVICKNALFYEAEKNEEFVKISCSVILNATDRSNCLKKEDILICTSADNIQNFGRIVDLTEHDYYPSPGCSYFQKPGLWKKLYLEITCAQSFTIKPPVRVRLQNLINIRTALKQNDALKCANPAMWPIVLNPKQNERFFQIVCVPPIENFSSKTNSVRSLQHRVTIVDTSTPPESITVVLFVAIFFKTHSMILVGVKDEETFLSLALQMKKHLNIVLAIREDEVSQLPTELRGLAVKNCDSETLKSCEVVLTLIPSLFFGEIEGRLTTETVICVIYEAQSFFETETALLLAYKVEHLILTGRRNVKASTSPMLSQYFFDISLFHRISVKQ